MRPDDVQRIVDDFAAHLDPPPAVPLARDTTFDEAGIDSLALMDLVFRLERECATSIPDDALPGLTTVGALVDHVAATAPDPA